MNPLDRIDFELSAIREKRLFRELTELQSGQIPEVLIGGKKYILLGSNGYLGLAAHTGVKKAAREALEKYGAGSGGSRLVSGTTDLHRELEEKIAAFKKTEAAIVFSSGYLANIGTIQAIAGAGDVIFSDELNHASIIDGCSLSGSEVRVYRHLDFGHLEDLIVAEKSAAAKLIVTDTVFSMDGDLADLSALCEIAEKHNCALMVDEAHATGVLGGRGSGATEHFGVESRVGVTMGTLSKAVGSTGGYIAGSKKLIEFIRNRARSFIFDTSPPASALAASLAAIEIIERDSAMRFHLWRMVDMFKTGLEKTGLEVLPSQSAIVPVLIGEPDDAMKFAAALRENGVYTPAVRPPSVPPGKCRIRASIMATHEKTHIEKAVKAFAKAKTSVL
ncbi:MAG: 8-amino-7-oxononanoate synthase [Candidatus Mycalebacterium zealandia]|nr:MAG: 8-amino-7-oxononanoate synthase [Candidatus Mycalebacterium zealandia]